MQRLSATVVSNELFAEECFQLSLKLPIGHQPPIPGQFLTMRVGEGIAPLLRRPFAYASCEPEAGTVSIIYERRGSATDMLTMYRESDSIDILGPLGNSFPAPDDSRRPILVAGGIGIGPMIFFHEALKKQGKEPILILGARTVSRIPLTLLPKGTIICTDDGSMGFRGTVLAALKTEIGFSAKESELYLCGPHGMMKAVSLWVRELTSQGHSLPCWASMEQTMGCAVGACMGCVVKVHHAKEYARVCVEGPIFDVESIDWT